MLGHIVQGVKLLDRQMSELDFPEEKKIMVEHMILAHHCEPEYGSPKRPLFPEAELLHHLDDLDAKMYDMEDALEKTQPGEFSERVWTLHNRRLYRPKKD
jgi:3'-5' exoribonuclease